MNTYHSSNKFQADVIDDLFKVANTNKLVIIIKQLIYPDGEILHRFLLDNVQNFDFIEKGAALVLGT